MTDKQWFKFYFAAWQRCAEANDWVMRPVQSAECRVQNGRGRVPKVFAGKQAPMFGQGEVRELYNQVWTAAAQIALNEHRALKPDDFRHACGIVALTPRGRWKFKGSVTKSSKDLTSAECDRVVTLFKMLTDPDDIDAQIDWDHPEHAAVRRLKWSIEHAAPDAYVRKIAADKFGTRLWEDLEYEQLQQLSVTLWHRNKGWRRPVEQQRREDAKVPAENQPF